MRVLHLSYEIYPVIGGVSTLIPLLLKGISADVCKIDLVTKTKDKNMPSSLQLYGHIIHTVLCTEPEGIDKNEEIRLQVKFYHILQQLFSENTYDLIHVHDALPIDIATFIKKQYPNIPMLISYHISHNILRKDSLKKNDGDRIKNGKAFEMEVRASKIGDFFHVASLSAKHWLINDYGIDSSKINLVPYGLDFTNYQVQQDSVKEALHRKLVPNGEKVILYAGRFVPQKGIEYLIKAFSKLLDSFSEPCKLLLIGEGYLKERLIQELDKLPQDTYMFIDLMLPEQLIAYFQMADVVVMPSIFEPFGLVSIEGMASGAAMIISNIDGLSEIVKDRYNSLALNVYENYGIRNIEVEELRTLMLELLQNKQLNEQIRTIARSDVRARFDFRKFGEGMLQTYQKIVNEGIDYNGILTNYSFT